MTHYGKITHFDSQSGTGMIAPQDGSEALPFDRGSFQQRGAVPRSDQVYTFETRGDADGRPMAVNLQMEQGPNARHEGPEANGNQGGFDQHGQSQARANQEAERRPGVDAQNAPTEPNDGASDYQPLRMDVGYGDRGEGGQQQGQNQNQNQRQDNGDHHGVSRRGVETQDAGVFRGSQSDHEGSVFQPLEGGRDDDRGHDKQRGNVPGQNQQGLNEGSRDRRDDEEPRGMAPDQSSRRP